MNAKRIIASFLIAMLILCGLWEGKVYAVNDDKTFIMGFDAAFPPYGFKDDNGDYVGFDIELAEEVCKRNNWTLVKQSIDWDSKDMELNSGSIDCIWNGFTMNGRMEKYTWSVPYIDNQQVVVVKKDAGINTLQDLKDKIVVVQVDSSALAAFTSEDATKENVELCKTFKDLQQVADYNSAFMNLESGMVDAICMDEGVASYQIKSRGADFIILDDAVAAENYAIGFKLGNNELRDQVNKALKEIEEDGTLEKIAGKWGLNSCVCIQESFAKLEEQKKEEVKKTETEEVENKKIDVASTVKQLGKGMLATLTIFVLTLLFSMPLGLLLTFVRMSKFKPLQWIAKLYISIMRGTPLMLQLLVVFFGPYYIFKVDMSYSYRFYAVIIGFSLNYAAYFAEIYRSGIQSISDGQREAATVLGYSKLQTFVKIIFPQMVKRVMPPVTNEVITLVKDTSLAFALAYTEIFTLAKQIAAANTSVMPLFIAGVFYYVFNFIVAFVMECIENKLNYYR